MKLIIANVHDEDALDLLDTLTEKKYHVTKLASTGRFLRSGNTTLMIGVEEAELREVIRLIEESCRTRSQVVDSPSPMDTSTELYMPFPVEIEVGGATIFVVDVQEFIEV